MPCRLIETLRHEVFNAKVGLSWFACPVYLSIQRIWLIAHVFSILLEIIIHLITTIIGVRFYTSTKSLVENRLVEWFPFFNAGLSQFLSNTDALASSPHKFSLWALIMYGTFAKRIKSNIIIVEII